MSDVKKEKFVFKEAYSSALSDFPTEAYSKDGSRGFDLTTLKAQYIVERLNEAFGVDGWQHTGTTENSGYEVIDGGVLYKGMLMISNGVSQISREAVGYSKMGKNPGDAYKGAKTDSLSKCASQVGIGNDMFKGLISPTGSSSAKPKTTLKSVAKGNKAEDF